jgi:tetratricopeptide (TPR) repeat protein
MICFPSRSRILIVCCAAAALLSFQCVSSRPALTLPAKKPRQDQIAKARAEENFIKARDLERRHRYEEAIEKYLESYKQDPSSKVLRDIIVSRYLDAGKFTSALVLVKGGKKNRELDTEDKRIVAGIYLRMRDFLKAVETIESISDKSGADYYSLAIMYEAAGDTARALKCYTAYGERTSVSLEMGLKIALMQVAQKRYQSADSLSSRLQLQYGDNAAVINLRGLIALACGDTAAALEFFNDAVAEDSLFNDGLRNIAQLSLQKNEYKKAVSCYETLYRRSPDPFKEVYGRSLAILYYYAREYGKAEVLLGKLCENLVNDEEIHYYLGLVFAAQERYDLARLELEKSLALRNDFYDAWRELVNLSIREKDMARALAAADRCTAKFPRIPGSWRLQGYVLNLKKEHDRAIAAFLKATAIDSLDAAAWFDLGSAYERKKDTKNAAVAFRKVLKLRPGDPTSSNYLGYMWADRGINLDSAKILIESALLQEPGNGAYLDSYAWVFFRKGERDSAFFFLEKAIARVNDDPVIFEHLGDILRERKNFKGAVEAYKKSIELNNETPDLIRRKIIEMEAHIHNENP